MYDIASPVLVIIPRPWHNILEAERALLTRILGSVRLKAASVLVQHRPQVTMEQLKAFQPGKVLIFGSSFEPGIPAYTCTELKGFSLIRADDLSDLDEVRKKNLWTALRQMFQV